jgi:uncharacterized protein (TIGR03435 family)
MGIIIDYVSKWAEVSVKVSTWAFRLVVLSLCVRICASQEHGDGVLRFEVASVKLADHHVPTTGPIISGGPGSKEPGQITWRLTSLLDVITRAYGLSDEQVSGPEWLYTPLYSIVAKIPPRTGEAQFDLMLQTLLAERFHLAAHHSSKDFAAYELVVANSGQKLKPLRNEPSGEATPPADAPAVRRFDAEGFPVLPSGAKQGISGKDGIVKARFRSSMPHFASQLGMLVRLSNHGGTTPRIVDKTGLVGEFEFTLWFAGSPQPEGDDADHSASAGPNLFTALQNQLGLQLLKGKRDSRDVLVIDHVDKVPTPN